MVSTHCPSPVKAPEVVAADVELLLSAVPTGGADVPDVDCSLLAPDKKKKKTRKIKLQISLLNKNLFGIYSYCYEMVSKSIDFSQHEQQI